MTDDTTRATLASTGAPLVLRDGAVAVIDALGFKGIWGRVDPAQVIRSMKEARQAANVDAELLDTMMGKSAGDLTVRFFSDSIVIVCMVPESGTLGDAVETVAAAVMHTITQAIHREPPLAYRGCIAAGQILADDIFFVGPAIDSAAEGAGLAEAAVVWLHESATVAFGSPGSEAAEALLFDWDVPLKRSGAISTKVVNPLALGAVEGFPLPWAEVPISALIERYMRTFESATVDVSEKKRNTRAALEKAEGRVGAQRREQAPQAEAALAELLAEASKP